MTDERWTLGGVDKALDDIEQAYKVIGRPTTLRALLLTARDGLTRAQGSESGSPRCSYGAFTDSRCERPSTKVVTSYCDIHAGESQHGVRLVEPMGGGCDTTVESMLSDEVIERLGLRGRDTVLQVTRLCDEINRLLAAVIDAGQPSEGDRERALDQIASSYDSGRVDDIGAEEWAGWAADTARAALRSAVCEKSDMERVDDWLHRRTKPGTPDLRMVWDREEKRSLAAEFAAVADRVREECARECRKVALIEDDAAATAGAAMHMAEERIARHGREIAFVIMRRILDAAPEGPALTCETCGRCVGGFLRTGNPEQTPEPCPDCAGEEEE